MHDAIAHTMNISGPGRSGRARPTAGPAPTIGSAARTHSSHVWQSGRSSCSRAGRSRGPTSCSPSYIVVRGPSWSSGHAPVSSPDARPSRAVGSCPRPRRPRRRGRSVSSGGCSPASSSTSGSRAGGSASPSGGSTCAATSCAALDRAGRSGEVGDDEVSAAIGVEAICSGVLEAAAGRLAAQAALAPPGAGPAARAGRVDVAAAAELLGISPEQCAERLERVERLEAAATLARAELVGGGAVAEELAKRRQEWLRLELGVLALDDVDAAREALLCMRLDGLEPTAVASRARRDLLRLSTTLAEAPEWLAPYVVGVGEGSVIGPVRHDPGVRSRRRRVEARAEPGRSGRSRARRGLGRGARSSTAGRRQDRVA